MLTTTPHLCVRRPSPTTAEFTVTTRPATTLALRAALLSLHFARLVFGLLALLLLYAAYEQRASSDPSASPYATDGTGVHEQPAPPFFTDAFIWYALARALASPPGRACTAVATAVPAWALVSAAVAALYAVVRRVHASESVLVLRGLGIQTSSTAATYLSSAATRFIPTEKIQDVLVNEAFRGFEARYYLVVVVEGEDDVVVVFPGLLPRKDIVETVWRGIRGCLYEGEGKVEEKA